MFVCSGFICNHLMSSDNVKQCCELHYKNVNVVILSGMNISRATSSISFASILSILSINEITSFALS